MKTLYPTSTRLRALMFVIFSFPFFLNAQELMRANLYVLDANGATLVDGNLTNYNNIYSNTVDMYDAWKMNNPGINFGILRNGQTLVVERRSLLTDTDTTFFRMWNLPKYNYGIRFDLRNLDHPGMSAFVKDTYLNTLTIVKLNDTTWYNFTIDANAASTAQLRFQLIYSKKEQEIIPVSFTGLHLKSKRNGVLVEWSVLNERSVESYNVEHSTDNRNFSSIQQVTSQNTTPANTYNYFDVDPVPGSNFYRIKAVRTDKSFQYSDVARLAPLKSNSISIFPNPVTNKTFQLHFYNHVAGTYKLQIVNKMGQVVYKNIAKVTGKNFIKSIELGSVIRPGIYQLHITDDHSKLTTQQLIIQ